MPHFRPRHIQARLQKLATFWPIVGVTGMRQVGKTTLLEKHFKFNSVASLDHDSTRADAENSAVSFASKFETPALIDEVQKVPKLFDALKPLVHKKKKPGQYFISGSVSFSEGTGIREFLTGRIGTNLLYPLTLGEALELAPPCRATLEIKEGASSRVSLQEFSKAMIRGGMPVPVQSKIQL